MFLSFDSRSTVFECCSPQPSEECMTQKCIESLTINYQLSLTNPPENVPSACDKATSQLALGGLPTCVGGLVGSSPPRRANSPSNLYVTRDSQQPSLPPPHPLFPPLLFFFHSYYFLQFHIFFCSSGPGLSPPKPPSSSFQFACPTLPGEA